MNTNGDALSRIELHIQDIKNSTRENNYNNYQILEEHMNKFNKSLEKTDNKDADDPNDDPEENKDQRSIVAQPDLDQHKLPEETTEHEAV